jgi:LemA protein
MEVSTIIVWLVMLALVIYVISIYNTLVSLKNRYQNAFAQIEVQLKRRYDLIPNLVETARAYMAHERETLDAVVTARNEAAAVLKALGDGGAGANLASLASAENKLQGALGKLNVTMEAYPDLKASENMQQLSEELTSTENRVAFARQGFNDAVMAYNTYRQSFPPVFWRRPSAIRATPSCSSSTIRRRSRRRPRSASRPLASAAGGRGLLRQQDRARRNTRLLVLLFAVAVLALVVLDQRAGGRVSVVRQDYNLYAGRGRRPGYLPGTAQSWERFGAIGPGRGRHGGPRIPGALAAARLRRQGRRRKHGWARILPQTDDPDERAA